MYYPIREHVDMIYKRPATFLRSYTHIKQSLVNLRGESASAESFESKFGNCAVGHKELSCEIYLQRSIKIFCVKYAACRAEIVSQMSQL